MNNYFLSLFKNNNTLSYENRVKLVESSKGLLVFDPVFTKPNLEPAHLAEILKEYGWFWVTIDADPSRGRSPHAVVVNDVSAISDSSQAKVQYYDVADGKIHPDNFTDFVQRVKNGALLQSHIEKSVIRLATSPHQGAKPNPLNKDIETRHSVYMEAINWIFDEYKNKQQHTDLFKVGYRFRDAAKKETELFLTYDKKIDAVIPPQLTFMSKTLNQEVTLNIVQAVQRDFVPTGQECEYKPNSTTIANLWKYTKPVYGGVRVLVDTGSFLAAATLGGWFKDTTNGGAPVMLSNLHVLRSNSTIIKLVSSDPDLGIMSPIVHAFTTLRAVDVSLINKDFAIAAPVDASYVPADMNQKGAEIVWGNKRYKTGALKDPAVGEKVMKIGSQTGLTTALVISYELHCIDRQKNVTPFTEPSNFLPRFKINNPAGCFADGDSGSLLLSATADSSTGRHHILGLLYASSGSSPASNCMSTVTLGYPIKYVCDELGLAPF